MVYALLLSVGVFFAATRTEVGRHVLRSAIERQFNDQFAGTLRIGHLSGNLVYRFTARDVRLLDDTGQLVVSIDSVVASPRWRRVTQGRIELGRLHLHGLRADLVRTAEGYWTISRALMPNARSDSSAGGLQSVSIGDLRIVDGTVSTVNLGSPDDLVRNGVLFDFENSVLRIGSASAIIDWRPTDAQIDLLGLMARVEERDFDIVEAQGQIVYNDNTFLANQVSIVTRGSNIRFTGSFDDLGNGRNGSTRLDVDLKADPLDHSELSRLLPKDPLRNSARMTARVRGPISALVVEELTAARGSSRVRVEGTVVGFPDSLDFELSVPEADISRGDLSAALAHPGILNSTQIGRLDFSLLGRGVVRDPLGAPDFSANFFVDAASDAGRVSGRISAEKKSGDRWHVSSDLFAGDLRVDRIVPVTEEPTSLTGDMSISISGATLRNLEMEAELALGASTILGRSVDSLKVLAAASAGVIRAEMEFVQGTGQARAALQADVSDTTQTFAFHATTRNLNLGPLLRRDSVTSAITSRMEGKFGFSNLDTIVGETTITLDSSSVATAGRRHRVAPGTVHLEVTRPETDITSLQLSGDVITGRVDVGGRLTDLAELSAVWTRHVRSSLRSDSAAHTALPAESGRRTHAGIDGVRSVTVSGSLTAANSITLSALLPDRAPVATNVTADFQLNVDSVRASVRLGIAGDSLTAGDLRFDRVSGALFASADDAEGLFESLTINSSLTSSRFSAGGSGIPDLDLSLTYRDESGEIEVVAGEGARVGPIDALAGVTLSDAGLEFAPKRFNVRGGGYDWALVRGEPVSIRSGIVRFEGLALENESHNQRVEVRGTVSSLPEDQLYVLTSRLDLQQVSRILSMRTALSGRLDGEFVVSRQDDTPIVESAATILGLGLDNRILGDVVISSSIRPGAAEGVLDLTITPTTVREGNRQVVANEAKVVGTFRLPSSDADGNRTDPGALDLSAEIERADLFFFEYIFPGTVQNVKGFTTGSVAISGSLSRPIFDANLRIADGSFRVPRFNLAMSLTADVDSDQYGIRIRRADFVDKTEGSVTLSGDILFNDYRYFSFNLEGRLDRFQIMDVATSRDLPFYGHIWASGTASLTGPLSQTQLRATSARSSPDSELYIPLVESQEGSDAGFIVFADSAGQVPDLASLTRRRNLLASRPRGERGFTEGMDMELNIEAPEGSTVHLVIDPLLGDVINGVGSGRVQILRREGQFETFGSFEVNSGDYLFTAGEVFVRRFVIEEGGQIVWDGDPTDARLDIPAAFRTRASRAGLQASAEGSASLIPVVVNLRITGRVSAPEVALALNIDRSNQTISSTSDQEFLETILNNPQLSTEYATSVLLTNSFALTTTGTSSSDAIGSGAFNSLSQLIAAQLNRYLSSALPNVDFSFGVQGQTSQELDITYGVALRLLDERLVIRGQGVYQGTEASTAESLQGEFVVEVRLSSNVSVEVFYRREGDLLVRTLTSTTGAGLSYRTEFPTWKRFLRRLFGWMLPRRESEPETPEVVTLRSAPRP